MRFARQMMAVAAAMGGAVLGIDAGGLLADLRLSKAEQDVRDAARALEESRGRLYAIDRKRKALRRLANAKAQEAGMLRAKARQFERYLERVAPFVAWATETRAGGETP